MLEFYVKLDDEHVVLCPPCINCQLEGAYSYCSLVSCHQLTTADSKSACLQQEMSLVRRSKHRVLAAARHLHCKGFAATAGKQEGGQVWWRCSD